ncbi:MAG: hypothetical protein AAF307_01305 [Pseudomonadota bacterium]
MNWSIFGAVLAVIAMAGCTNRNDRPTFDGQYFRVKAAKVDDQRDAFTVRVRDVSRSLDGAREAGRYGGIEYCIATFGSSKIAWTVGPDTPPEALQISDNTIVFSGVCPDR